MNRLTPNLLKSNYIVIASPHSTLANDFVIKLRESNLEKVSTVKYLGVLIDDRLNWKSHINSVCSRIAPVIGVLSRLRWSLPNNICRLIYMSLIHCHIMYCIEVWGCA